MPLFTRENAREFARRGNLARWSRCHSQPPAENTPPQPPAIDAATTVISRQLDIVHEQIKDTRELLTKQDKRLGRCEACKRPFGLDPKDRAQLLKALDALLDRERILRGIPLPGSHRPTAPRRMNGNGAAMQPIDLGQVRVLPATPENGKPSVTEQRGNMDVSQVKLVSSTAK